MITYIHVATSILFIPSGGWHYIRKTSVRIMHSSIAIYFCMFLESKRWSNIALKQPAWSSVNSSVCPASHAVDGYLTTSGYTGSVALPFLAVDLGSNVSVGFVSLRFAGSTWRSQYFENLSLTHNVLGKWQLPYSDFLLWFTWWHFSCFITLTLQWA